MQHTLGRLLVTLSMTESSLVTNCTSPSSRHDPATAAECPGNGNQGEGSKGQRIFTDRACRNLVVVNKCKKEHLQRRENPPPSFPPPSLTPSLPPVLHPFRPAFFPPLGSPCVFHPTLTGVPGPLAHRYWGWWP